MKQTSIVYHIDCLLHLDLPLSISLFEPFSKPMLKGIHANYRHWKTLDAEDGVGMVICDVVLGARL